MVLGQVASENVKRGLGGSGSIWIYYALFWISWPSSRVELLKLQELFKMHSVMPSIKVPQSSYF